MEYDDEFKLNLERMVKGGDFFARDGDEMLDALIAKRDEQRDEELVEGLARELFIMTESSGTMLGRKGAAELWDKEKYDVLDYGGEDFNFTCKIQEKNGWRTKARTAINAAREKRG